MFIFSRLRGRDVRDSLPYRAPLYPPLAGHVIFCDHVLLAVLMCVVLCVGGKFAFTFAFYFLDVDILIRPEDAQKYVSGRSFVLFFL